MQKNVILLVILATYATSAAFAGLGEREASIEIDSAALTAYTPQMLNPGSYKVYQITKKNRRLTLREYVNQNGVVFGVAWEGSYHPHMAQVLGSYHQEYQTHVQNNPKPKGHRSHFHVASEHIKVIKYGHMGWVQGKAYAPELFPTGVEADEIQ